MEIENISIDAQSTQDVTKENVPGNITENTGNVETTKDNNQFETPKDDNEDDLDDDIILQISEKDNLYLFKRLEKQINQSTSLITEKIKSLASQMELIHVVKQQFEDHKFQTKKQIQLINTRMIEAELKADELQKRIEDLENENKSLKTEVTKKSKKEIIHVEDTIKKEQMDQMENKVISLESITVQLKSKNESLENAIAKIEQNNNITNERNFNELTSQINILKASSQPQSQRGDMNRQSITNHIQREIRSWRNVDENDSTTTTDLMWEQRPQYYSDNTPNDDNTPTRDRTTNLVLLIDSNGKFIIPSRLNRYKVCVKFGCPTIQNVKNKVDEMKSSRFGLIPDQLLIHVGTNDIEHMSQEIFTDMYKDLINDLKHPIFSRCKIYISGLLHRADRQLWKVKIANRVLAQLCEINNVTFIKHDNISDNSQMFDDKHLNRYSGFPIFLNNLRSTLFEITPGRRPYNNGRFRYGPPRSMKNISFWPTPFLQPAGPNFIPNFGPAPRFN